FGRHLRGSGTEKVNGNVPIPDRAMHGAVDRLVTSLEEGLDLVVGAIDRAGPTGLVHALAGQSQRGFGKGPRLDFLLCSLLLSHDLKTPLSPFGFRTFGREADLIVTIPTKWMGKEPRNEGR